MQEVLWKDCFRENCGDDQCVVFSGFSGVWNRLHRYVLFRNLISFLGHACSVGIVPVLSVVCSWISSDLLYRRKIDGRDARAAGVGTFYCAGIRHADPGGLSAKICTTDQSLDTAVSFEPVQFRASLWKQLVLTEMVSVCKK